MKPLALTLGDPAGIGPEILLRLISRQPEVGELPEFKALLPLFKESR